MQQCKTLDDGIEKFQQFVRDENAIKCQDCELDEHKLLHRRRHVSGFFLIKSERFVTIPDRDTNNPERNDMLKQNKGNTTEN